MNVAKLVAGTALVAFAVLSAPLASGDASNCRAWIGARGTGQCIDDQPVFGPPPIGFNGVGVETGPLLPGNSVNIPLG